jgi:FtsP/CotA-like multicopper oxidase with cupredoxin domain
MSTTEPHFDFELAAAQLEPEPPDPRRDWLAVAIGLTLLVSIMAVIAAVFALAGSTGDKPDSTVVHKAAAAPAADAEAPTLADAKGVKFEPFQRVDPTLPPVPAGAVKRFRIDVLQHVTQVDPALAPTEAWSYTVNGKAYHGTAASPPIVVNEGDRVEITFVNGGSKAMNVTMPHSIDFHAAEVAPNEDYVDVAPGKHLRFSFTADHPGVFMYHCATQPVLMHTSAGMMGMMVVKPRNLARVDKEFWLTQEEFYLGAPGKPADMVKMEAEKPDVMAFNGYANQYKTAPITVRKGQKVRVYVLDAGPSKGSAFHVIGTVFDKTHIEGVTGHDSQTAALAPSQGGWVEFTLDHEGNYPFVTHAFGDMVKGAAGMFRTTHAPKPTAPAAAAKAPAAGDVQVTMGDMWIKSSVPSVKAGKVTFAVKNAGATMHGMAITPAPVKLDGADPDESAFVAGGPHLQAGGTATVTANLKPGRYELVCHLPGHYAAGQKLAFTVN